LSFGDRFLARGGTSRSLVRGGGRAMTVVMTLRRLEDIAL
jgi:hypothetical protein